MYTHVHIHIKFLLLVLETFLCTNYFNCMKFVNKTEDKNAKNGLTQQSLWF